MRYPGFFNPFAAVQPIDSRNNRHGSEWRGLILGKVPQSSESMNLGVQADFSHPYPFSTTLIWLWLDKNQISDIKPLKSLTNLIALNLDKNLIGDIKPLVSLTNLTSLTLDNNQIIDIKPLESLTKLRALYLSGNAIAPKTCPLKPESICKWERDIAPSLQELPSIPEVPLPPLPQVPAPKLPPLTEIRPHPLPSTRTIPQQRV